MKKLLSVLLSFIMLAEFTLSAYAAGQSVGVVSQKLDEANILEYMTAEDGTFYEFLTTEDSEIGIVMATAPRNSEEGGPINACNFDTVTAFLERLFGKEGLSTGYQKILATDNSTILQSSYFSSSKQIAGKIASYFLDNTVFMFVMFADINSDETKLANTFTAWTDSIEVKEIKTEDIDYSSYKDIIGENPSTFANVLIANKLAYEDKWTIPSGHGWAAENANTLIDQINSIFSGKVSTSWATVSGNNNAENGADRIITKGPNGQILEMIQSKYYQTASASINACFDKETGIFRYLDGDGNPMTIEVPKDQYNAAVAAMEKKIRDGKVPNVTDPAKAKDIVKKGSLTYTQAKNLAKAGTIESLTYDALNGAIVFAGVGGISAIAEFAISKWNGDSTSTALKKSLYKGLEVGGSSFIVTVMSSQLAKAGVNSLLVPSSEALVSAIGPKASAVLINATRIGSGAVAIHGASAMSSLAKLLRGNAIASTVALVVASVPDIVNVFRGRISGKQLLKNVAETAGGIAGGVGGWTLGAAIGQALIPIPGVGAVVGGLVVGAIAGAAGNAAVGAVADLIAEDDADEMLDIISKRLEVIATNYLLNETELNKVTEELSNSLDANKLQDMYASENREKFADDLLIPLAESTIKSRAHITQPSEEAMQKEMVVILEDIYDEMEAEGAN